MDLGISGRTAIVCASSKGLGKGCAFALAREGVNVVINGRTRDVLDATAEEISKETNVTVIPVAADVSTPEGQQALLNACPSSPDILINNNGGPPLKDFRDIDREAMIAGVVQNMVTPIELIQQVLGPMVDRRFGRIVNITSLSVKMPILGLDLSSGARAGLTAFLGGPARDVAKHNVTVNGLLPGMFDTDRLRASTKRMAEMQGVPEDEARDSRTETVPARRFGTPDEFGQFCAFLCSEHAGYLTGQNFLMDGGLFNSSI